MIKDGFFAVAAFFVAGAGVKSVCGHVAFVSAGPSTTGSKPSSRVGGPARGGTGVEGAVVSAFCASLGGLGVEAADLLPDFLAAPSAVVLGGVFAVLVAAVPALGVAAPGRACVVALGCGVVVDGGPVGGGEGTGVFAAPTAIESFVAVLPTETLSADGGGGGGARACASLVVSRCAMAIQTDTARSATPASAPPLQSTMRKTAREPSRRLDRLSASSAKWTLSSGGLDVRGGSTGSKSQAFLEGIGGIRDGRSSVVPGSVDGCGRALDSSARSAKETSESGVVESVGVMGSSTRPGSAARGSSVGGAGGRTGSANPPTGPTDGAGAGESMEGTPDPEVPWIAWSRWCSRRQPSQLVR